MLINFDNDELETFVTTGNAESREYKKLRSNGTIKKYLPRVYLTLQAATNVTELSQIQALHYEKLKGDRIGQSSVRIG